MAKGILLVLLSRLTVINALVFFAFTAPVHASLIGTSVTGSLTFLGNSTNRFDPANGFVPATGYENASGTTVTVAEPAIEFGAVFPANTDTANLTASQLIVTDVVQSPGTNLAFTITLTDTAFSGLTLSKVSDTFTSGGTSASLTGDMLKLTWSGGSVAAGALQTVYDLTPSSATPEPSSFVLLLAGLIGGGLCLYRKQTNAAK